MENSCRTCLGTTLQLFPLFADSKLVAALEAISSIEMQEIKSYPNQICEECIDNINRFYMFQQSIISSDREIRKKLFEEPLKSNADESLTFHKETQNLCLKECNNNSCDSEDDIKIKSNNEINCKPKFNMLKEEDCKISVEHIKIEMDIDDDQNQIKVPINSAKELPAKSKVPTRVCNICGKSITYYNLRAHLKYHLDVPVKCDICGKLCKNASRLRDHLYVHKREELNCHHCGKIYKSRQHFKLHVQEHDNIPRPKKHKCSVCEKAFHMSTTLTKHMRSHTGERPHICEFCGKGYTSTYALKTHRRQHTNEKPYKCDFCEMAYPQKVSLVTHMKSKHSQNVKK